MLGNPDRIRVDPITGDISIGTYAPGDKWSGEMLLDLDKAVAVEIMGWSLRTGEVCWDTVNACSHIIRRGGCFNRRQEMAMRKIEAFWESWSAVDDMSFCFGDLKTRMEKLEFKMDFMWQPGRAPGCRFIGGPALVRGQIDWTVCAAPALTVCVAAVLAVRESNKT